MLIVRKAPLNLLAAGAALLGMLTLPITIHAQAGYAATLDAQFRGCESTGWCSFWIESLDPAGQLRLHRVRPQGVSSIPGDKATSTAIRDRLNFLMSDMIHQAKHIELSGLHDLSDGTFAATVTVNGVDLASDPIIQELHSDATGTGR
jgi:hypothetical protein